MIKMKNKTSLEQKQVLKKVSVSHTEIAFSVKTDGIIRRPGRSAQGVDGKGGGGEGGKVRLPLCAMICRTREAVGPQ